MRRCSRLNFVAKTTAGRRSPDNSCRCTSSNRSITFRAVGRRHARPSEYIGRLSIPVSLRIASTASATLARSRCRVRGAASFAQLGQAPQRSLDPLLPGQGIQFGLARAVIPDQAIPLDTQESAAVLMDVGHIIDGGQLAVGHTEEVAAAGQLAEQITGSAVRAIVGGVALWTRNCSGTAPSRVTVRMYSSCLRSKRIHESRRSAGCTQSVAIRAVMPPASISETKRSCRRRAFGNAGILQQISEKCRSCEMRRHCLCG